MVGSNFSGGKGMATLADDKVEVCETVAKALWILKNIRVLIVCQF
jgi:hypothetical protein